MLTPLPLGLANPSLSRRLSRCSAAYGVLRNKRGGGDNGHNGLRSITRSLGTS